MIFQEYLDCPPSDFFDGVDTGYLLESFAKKHMTYTVSQHNIIIVTFTCRSRKKYYLENRTTLKLSSEQSEAGSKEVLLHSFA